MRRRAAIVPVVIATFAALALRHVAAAEPTPPRPPAMVNPQAVATAHAERDLRRRQIQAMSPEERSAFRAARRAEADRSRPARPVELRGPFPLPVEVKNGYSGAAPHTTPAGGSCTPGESCTLTLQAPAGMVLVVTAVWSATSVQCDQLTTATPANGAPISVAWRCEHTLVVRGPGAGYAGYLTAR